MPGRYGAASTEGRIDPKQPALLPPQPKELRGAQERGRTAGLLESPDRTAGIRLSGDRPGSWTRWLDFLATGTDAVLKHEQLELRADGTLWLADGVIEATHIGPGAVDQFHMATGLFVPEIVSSLPTLPHADYPQGALVFLTTDNKLYRSTGSSWTVAVPAVDITGQIVEAQIANAAVTGNKIASEAVSLTKFASGLRPVEIVSSLPSPGTAGRVVFLTTDNKLYRDTGSAWTVAVPAADVTGEISTSQIADDAVTAAKLEVAGSLVMDELDVKGTGLNNPANRRVSVGGRVDVNSSSRGFCLSVLKRSDHSNLSYRRDGTGSGTLAANQVYDIYATDADRVDLKNALVELRTNGNATRASGEWGDDIVVIITSADAWNVDNSNGSLLVDELLLHGATEAIRGVGSASDHRTPYVLVGIPNIGEGRGIEIKTGIGTTDPPAHYQGWLANGTPTGLGKMAPGTVSANLIAAGAVVTEKLAAEAVTAAKIAANTIVAGNIAAGTITGTEIATDTILAGNIAAGAIGTSELDADAVTAGKIAAGSIAAEHLFVGSFDNLVRDPGFEEFSGLPGRWTVNTAGGGTWAINTALPRSGARCIQYNPTGQTVEAKLENTEHAGGSNTDGYAVAEGDKIYAEAWVRKVGTGNANRARVVIAWRTETGTWVSSNQAFLTPTQTYQKVSISGTAPANAAQAFIQLSVLSDSNPETILFDDVYARRMVSGELIVDGSIITQHIAAGAVDTTQLAAEAVTAAKIAAGTITTNEIAADTIVAGNIAAGAIGTSEIFAGAVTADKITVTNLAAIKTDLGEITAGHLKNSGNTAAIRLSGATALPTTNYIDFTATGNALFLKTGDGSTKGLTIQADGDAEFFGTVKSTQFVSSGALFDDGSGDGYIRVGNFTGGIRAFVKADNTASTAEFSIASATVVFGEIKNVSTSDLGFFATGTTSPTENMRLLNSGGVKFTSPLTDENSHNIPSVQVSTGTPSGTRRNWSIWGQY